MAEEQIIFSVKYDTEQAHKNMEALVTEQVELRKEAKQLSDQYKAGTLTLNQYGKELTLNQQALRRNSKELVDTRKILDATSGSIGSQRLRLSQLKQEWVDIDKTTKTGRKRFAELGKEIKALNDDIKVQEQGIGVFSRSVGDYTNSILDAAKQTDIFGVNVGQISVVVNLLGQAVNSTTGKVKILNTTLKALGGGVIAVLLVALGSLLAFFKRTQEGSDLLDAALSGVGAALDVLLDRFTRFGEVIINVMTGKQGVIAATKEFLNLLKGIPAEIQKETKAAIELTKAQQDLRKQRVAFIQNEAILLKAIEEGRLATEDATRSEQERVKSGRATQRLINILAEERISKLRQEQEILKGQIGLSISKLDADEKIAELNKQIFEADVARARQLKEVTNQINAINKAVADKAAREEIKALNEEYKAFQERTKEIPKLFAQSNKNFLEGFAKGLTVTSKQFDDFIDENTKKLEKQAERAREIGNKQQEERTKQAEILSKKELLIAETKEQGRLELAASTTNALAILFKQESAAYKALASATAIIDTYRAANLALASPPGPPATIPFMIAAIVQGLANVAAINNIQFAQGGILPDKNGQILQGPSHAQGGIRLEAEGGEVVLTRKVSQSPYLLSLASEINQQAGGRSLAPRSYMADGGIAVRSIDREASQFANQEASMERVINRMKQPIVLVKDLRKGINRSVDVETKAKVG